MTTQMDALAAALEGRYAVEREIGAGGMATVYLARDVRHDRRVALKVLSPELGAVLGAERFLSEIRVTANLQHPNLLPLFDSGEAGGLLFYVMPFVEGETLRHRLDREKQLPVEEAVRIAVGIAGALDYAHRHGVIHRDLKPENILLQDDQPLVADFGIALAVSNAGGTRITQTGLSLGTPQYMSPEQATGDRVVDARTDIYSLGALTYEMLAGEPPHSGSTAQAIIARLMTEEPRPLSAVRRNVPPHVEAAVACALEKLPADRFATAKEFADALQGRGARTMTNAVATRARREPTRVNRAIAGVAITAALIAVASLAAWWRASHVPPAQTVRFTVEAPEGGGFGDVVPGLSVALSPDGQTLAFVAGAPASLYVRRLNQLNSTLVSNLGEAGSFTDIHFSPDGKWLGYFGGGKGYVGLQKIDISEVGGSPVPVVALTQWNGASWGYGPGMVYDLDAALWLAGPDGRSRKIASGDATHTFWTNPTMLPDGNTVAVRATNAGQAGGSTARIAFVTLRDGGSTISDLAGQFVVGYADGVLVFSTAEGRLMAVRFDLAHRKPIGDPVVVLDNVSYKGEGGAMAALSDNGTLAYLVGSPELTLEVRDEKGVTAAVGDTRLYSHPAWSPDGGRIAVAIVAGGSPDIWVLDTRTRVLSRLTQSGGAQPVWTRDGKRILFTTRKGEVWSVSADGSGAPSRLAGSDADHGKRVTEIAASPDGRFALLRFLATPSDSVGTHHVYALPLAGGSAIPLPVGVTGSPDAADLMVSPNGRWIAYSSNFTGRSEVYVRPFPGGDGQVQISSEGGTEPHWSPDGRRLFYRFRGAYSAASLDVSRSMPSVIRTDSLFSGGYTGSYDVSPDGKRLLLTRPAGGSKLIVVTNWITEVRAKLGMK